MEAQILTTNSGFLPLFMGKMPPRRVFRRQNGHQSLFNLFILNILP
jgi:hypothetical protein